jgi:hypothetical protein
LKKRARRKKGFSAGYSKLHPKLRAVPNLGEAGGKNHIKSAIKMPAFFVFKKCPF